MEPTYKDLLVVLSDITPEEAFNKLRENPNHELKEQYEFIIKKYPKWAYYYALNVIKGRWHEAEDIIKTDPYYARWYACYVIKDKNFWDNN